MTKHVAYQRDPRASGMTLRDPRRAASTCPSARSSACPAMVAGTAHQRGPGGWTSSTSSSTRRSWVVRGRLARGRAAGRVRQRLHHHPLQRRALHRHAGHAVRRARCCGCSYRTATTFPNGSCGSEELGNTGLPAASVAAASWASADGHLDHGRVRRSWPAFVTTRTPVRPVRSTRSGGNERSAALSGVRVRTREDAAST